MKRVYMESYLNRKKLEKAVTEPVPGKQRRGTGFSKSLKRCRRKMQDKTGNIKTGGIKTDEGE